MAEKNLNTFWAELIVEELLRCGIEYFCISPGSRSTPLVVAVARKDKARSIVWYDERGAAFHALGYARATGKPAAVITTSGTAAANLYPAVIEADAGKVPMIVLTADRPGEMVDTAANQTINQEGIFGGFCRWQFSFPCPCPQIPPEAVLTAIDQAVYRSIGGNPGPVHLNCRYRKPLEPPGATVKTGYIRNIDKWAGGTGPFTAYQTSVVSVGSRAVKLVGETMNGADRAMVVIGELSGEDHRDSVLRLMEKLNLPVYADITSGIRLASGEINVMRYFDQELLPERFNRFARPSFVLHLGGRVTSKRVGEFFDQNRPDHYIVVQGNPDRCDPINAVTMRIEANPAWFCGRLAGEIRRRPGEYGKFFIRKGRQADKIIAEGIEGEKRLSEPFVARRISEDMPEGSCLFLSSSMPVRDMDLYGRGGRTGISVSANRGVSGIDGVISTASGFAAGGKKPTTLVIGDLAFIHDINALAVIKKISVPIVMVVVNNNGSGIFHFLPIAKCEDVFERYFAAGHNFSFGGVSETFGIDYYKAADKAGFVESYRQAVQKKVPAVIEVVTDRKRDFLLRRKIKKKILDILVRGIK